MNVRSGTVHITAEIEADGRTRARRIVVVDAETGKREQIWPEVRRPVLSVPVLTQRRPVTGERAAAGT